MKLFNIFLLVTALIVSGCASSRIRCQTLKGATQQGTTQQTNLVNIKIHALGYKDCYVKQVSFDKQLVIEPFPFDPDSYERTWNGTCEKGVHTIGFIRNDGETYEKNVAINKNSLIEIYPTKWDAFMDNEAPFMLGPLAVVTWPAMSLIMVISGQGD